MPLVHRVLPPAPIESLEEYVKARGGRGIEAARHEDAETLIAEVEAAGLRGRGGAGFPTGRKWRTVRENASDALATTVVVEHADDVGSGSGLSAHVEMAGPENDTGAPPTLVDNVETMANVPRIISRGADWFRTEGTAESPGTIVCTITGSTRRAGVGEVLMGTPLREVIEIVGGGPRRGHRIKAVMPGVSSGVIPEHLLDTPVSYEAMADIGSGLGAGG